MTTKKHNPDVKAKCRDCQATVTIKRATLVLYKRIGRQPLCDECRVRVFQEKNKRNMKDVRIANKIRSGKADAEKQAARDAKNRFAAPCGRTIKNTNKSDRKEGPCHRCNMAGNVTYYICRDEAAKRDWQGWAIEGVQ